MSFMETLEHFTVALNFERKTSYHQSKGYVPFCSEERLIETTHLSYISQPLYRAHNPSVTALAMLCYVLMPGDFPSTQSAFLFQSFTTCAFKM